jgi:uncharacterized protein (DUF697 family)
MRKVNAGQALLRGDLGGALALSQPGLQIPTVPHAQRPADSYLTANAVPYLQLDHWQDAKRAADDFSNAISGIGVSARDTRTNMDDVLRSAQLTDAAGSSKDALAALKKAYDGVKSTVSGVLKGALEVPAFKAGEVFNADQLKGKGLSFDAQVTVDDILPRADSIQEDARRLADVVVKGFDSPWADYFKIQFPKMWSEIASGGDIRMGAAKVLQEFQQGLRPDLLNFDALKEQVKNALLGQQAFEGMAKDITDQLVAELGVSVQDVQGALSGVVGPAAGGVAAAPDMTTQGSTAGTSFSNGFGATANGATIVATITAQITATLASFESSGKTAGTKWSGGFYSSVESGLAPDVVSLLAVLVTPGVAAILRTQQSQTGSNP